jgi:hypothetical protein
VPAACGALRIAAQRYWAEVWDGVEEEMRRLANKRGQLVKRTAMLMFLTAGGVALAAPQFPIRIRDGLPGANRESRVAEEGRYE